MPAFMGRWPEMPAISVIICAHNPRPDYLSRVLDALKAQTLPGQDWELLLIDNASAEPLADRYDLSWHPAGRHIRENDLGLTPARLCGIAEAKGDLLIFVDDDNVLATDYLENARAIADKWPILGAWGGTIRGEFEVQPAPGVQDLLAYLAIRKISAPIWSNDLNAGNAQPWGAGMCVRAGVARTYADRVSTQPWRRSLDRKGQSLISSGDIDLALTSCDLGLGQGNFPQLVVTHLIPAARLERGYLLRLMRGITISNVLVAYYRSGRLPEKPSAVVTAVGFAFKCLTRGWDHALKTKVMRDAIAEAIGMARSGDAATTMGRSNR